MKIHPTLSHSVSKTILLFLLTSLLLAQANFLLAQTKTTFADWHPDADLYAKPRAIESLQFAFMIGDWDIVGKQFSPFTGKVRSEVKAWQHVEYLSENRMVFDEWIGYSLETGEQVTHGVTLRTYSEKQQQWHNTFLRSFSQSEPYVSTSKWDGKEMRSEALLQNGKVRLLSRFYDIKKDSYQWESRISIDDGKTWNLQATQSALRRDSNEE